MTNPDSDVFDYESRKVANASENSNFDFYIYFTQIRQLTPDRIEREQFRVRMHMHKLFRCHLILCLLPPRYPPFDIPLCLLVRIQFPVPNHLRVIAFVLLHKCLNPFFLPLALRPLRCGCEGRLLFQCLDNVCRLVFSLFLHVVVVIQSFLGRLPIDNVDYVAIFIALNASFSGCQLGAGSCGFRGSCGDRGK